MPLQEIGVFKEVLRVLPGKHTLLSKLQVHGLQKLWWQWRAPCPLPWRPTQQHIRAAGCKCCHQWCCWASWVDVPIKLTQEEGLWYAWPQYGPCLHGKYICIIIVCILHCAWSSLLLLDFWNMSEVRNRYFKLSCGCLEMGVIIEWRFLRCC